MALNSVADIKNRLKPSATALVEKAIPAGDPVVLEALLDACILLEDSSKSDAP